jgi:hypothetical protein
MAERKKLAQAIDAKIGATRVLLESSLSKPEAKDLPRMILDSAQSQFEKVPPSTSAVYRFVCKPSKPHTIVIIISSSNSGLPLVLQAQPSQPHIIIVISNIAIMVIVLISLCPAR